MKIRDGVACFLYLRLSDNKLMEIIFFVFSPDISYLKEKTDMQTGAAEKVAAGDKQELPHTLTGGCISGSQAGLPGCDWSDESHGIVAVPTN